MNIVLIIFLVLIALGLIIVIYAQRLPSDIHFERSMTMKASPEAIFQEINNLRNWTKWSPWYKKDPNMELSYGSITEGEGGTYSWSSKSRNVGSGSMKITKSVPHSLIETELNFQPNNPSQGYWKIEQQGDECNVTWGLHSNMGDSVAGKIMGSMMDKFLDKDFTEGLSGIKSIVEKS